MQFKAPEVPVSYTAPDEYISDHEKTASWYMQWIRYGATFFNQARTKNYQSKDSNNSSNINASSLLNFSDEIKQNMDYYFGRQDNIDFNYLTEDNSGASIQNPWIKGKHAAKLIDFMKGTAVEIIKSLEFSAKTIDPNTIKDKELLFSQAELQRDLKAELALLKQFGIHFDPINQEFELDEELEDWKKQFQTAGEELAVATAEEIYEDNNGKYRYLSALLHILIGGIGAMENTMENGKLKKTHIPSHQLIFDNRIDSDLGEYGRLAGYVKPLSIGEAISIYGNELRSRYGEEAIDDLKSLAKGEGAAEDFMTYYNAGCSNFSWYSRQPDSMQVTAATLYFIAPRDIGIKKTRNKFGETRFKRLSLEEQKESKVKGDFITGDLHRGTLLGNRWLVNWGLCKNVTRSIKNKGNPILPITMCIPNMANGEPRATMTMLKNNQNEIDRLGYIIRGLTGKDYGRVMVFRTPLGENFDILKANDDLKNLGMTYVPYNADMPDELKNIPWLEVQNLSQIEHIGEYVKLRQEEERIMEEILNFSKAALGQQNGYISQGAQDKTITSSSMGTSYLYDIFMKWIELDTRVGVNMQKMNYSVGKNEEMIRFIHGKAGVKFLRATQGNRYEDVNIYVKIQDTVDAAARARILSYAQGWSQNVEWGVEPLDILAIERERTWSGMIRHLEYSMKRKKAAGKRAAAEQQMLDQVRAEQQNSALMQQEALRQQGATQRTGMQEQGKAFNATLSHQAAQQQPVPTA